MSATPPDCIALYKGKPDEFWHTLFHYATCFFLSIRKLRIVKHSHAELCLDGVCYSSSVRDGGARAKLIDLTSGKWDIVPIELTPEQKQYALNYFKVTDGWPYDFLGAIGVVLPLFHHLRYQLFCFEIVAEMLRMPDPSHVTPVELARFQ